MRARDFIIGPWQDSATLIFMPALALGLWWLLFGAPGLGGAPVLPGMNAALAAVLFGQLVTQSHIILVGARTHLDPKIFKTHVAEFTAVPTALFALGMLSQTLLVWMFAIGVLWDVYHSCGQTFGIARIYDQKIGNPAQAGRTLDLIFCIVTYVGPLLASRNFAALLSTIVRGRYVIPLFEVLFGYARGFDWLIALGVGAVAVPFLAYYVLAYRRLIAGGYRLSYPKTALLAVSAIVSCVAWMRLSFIGATLVVNLFHGLQYFAIVWWAEGKNLRARLRLGEDGLGRAAGLAVMVAAAAAYGALIVGKGSLRPLFCLATVCSLMHYWYDGFVWSVRKNQV